jgi:hypothetical protein
MSSSAGKVSELCFLQQEQCPELCHLQQEQGQNSIISIIQQKQNLELCHPQQELGTELCPLCRMHRV